MKQANNALVRKLRFNRRVALASLTVAAMTVGSSQALASIVCSMAPIGVPASIDGLYLNFVTGVASIMGSTAGWDFNAYASGGQLNFFSSNSTNNTTRYVGIATTVDVLGGSTMIDATSPLSTAGVAPGGIFRGGVSNGFIGVVFKNESTAVTNYGWVSLTTAGPNGFPATINQYCYQNNGTGIPAGGNQIFKSGFEA